MLLSVVLFAGASQPHAVWLSCTSIAAGTLVWSVIPAPHSTSAMVLVCEKEVADHV